MDTYIVKFPVKAYQRFEVDADSLEDAVERIWQGEGTPIEDTLSVSSLRVWDWSENDGVDTGYIKGSR